MTDAPDAELLERFVRDQSGTAFAELVRRHIALVHSVALRHTTHPQQAEDIVQAVFIILARKAPSLSPKVILSGWLYHAARLTAANWQRAETRRIRREQEAFMQHQTEKLASEETWRELSPLLEDAMARLGAGDRDAIVLRFFNNQSLADVGRTMGIAERAAQKRVNRALEKLRKFFTKRGVVSTTAIIAGAISSNSVQAAPVALVQSVSAAAIAKGATASASTLTLIKGALKVMAWTKAKTTTVIIVAAIAGTLVTTVAVKKLVELRKPSTMLLNGGAYPGDWIWTPSSVSLSRVPPLFILRPTKLPARSIPWEMFGTGRYLARGKTVKELLAAIYSQKDSRLKLTFNAPLPDDKLDCLVTLQDTNWWEELRSEINEKYNVVEQPGNPGEVLVETAN